MESNTKRKETQNHKTLENLAQTIQADAVTMVLIETFMLDVSTVLQQYILQEPLGASQNIRLGSQGLQNAVGSPM